MFWHEGEPYGFTAAKIIEDGGSIQVRPGSVIRRSDVEFVTVTLDEAQAIFAREPKENL